MEDSKTIDFKQQVRATLNQDHTTRHCTQSLSRAQMQFCAVLSRCILDDEPLIHCDPLGKCSVRVHCRAHPSAPCCGTRVHGTLRTKHSHIRSTDNHQGIMRPDAFPHPFSSQSVGDDAVQSTFISIFEDRNVMPHVPEQHEHSHNLPSRW